jgi:hypothetical protein
MEKIRTLANAQILVSGHDAHTVVGNMIESGLISDGAIKEYSFSVKITKTESGWKIPYGDKENVDFVKALALAEMIDFMN